MGFGRVALALIVATTVAHADEPSDRTRIVHGAVTAAMGVAYLTAEFGFNKELSPTTCKWCAVDGFDAAARDALRWRDTAAANTTSSVTGYVLAPVAATGLSILAAGHASWRRHFDDVVPVIQSAIAVSLLQHVTKLLAARQRPFAHYAAPGALAPSEEDNVSFWSGHTSLCFSLAVSSATIASRRGYRLAPLLWASGLGLAAATGYLRIAADRHYATDVLTGAAMGSLVGYVWPVLVHPHIQRDVAVVPNGQGVAVVGTF